MYLWNCSWKRSRCPWSVSAGKPVSKKKKKREKNQSINNQLQKCNYGAISAFVRNALMLKSHCDYY